MPGVRGNGAANGRGDGADGVASTPPAERARVQYRADAQAAARAAAADAADEEETALRERLEHAHAEPRPTAQDPDAGLMEVARALLDAAQSSASAAGSTVGAFHKLVRADVALARASVVSGTMIGAFAAVAALTTWLLAVTLLVVGLVNAGLPLWGALAVAALVTLLVAGGCAMFAKARFAGADLAATRRQWHMLRHGRYDPAQEQVARQPAGIAATGAASTGNATPGVAP